MADSEASATKKAKGGRPRDRRRERIPREPYDLRTRTRVKAAARKRSGEARRSHHRRPAQPPPLPPPSSVSSDAGVTDEDLQAAAELEREWDAADERDRDMNESIRGAEINCFKADVADALAAVLPVDDVSDLVQAFVPNVGRWAEAPKPEDWRDYIHVSSRGIHSYWGPIAFTCESEDSFFY
jgi:hypothetical protein